MIDWAHPRTIIHARLFGTLSATVAEARAGMTAQTYGGARRTCDMVSSKPIPACQLATPRGGAKVGACVADCHTSSNRPPEMFRHSPLDKIRGRK